MALDRNARKAAVSYQESSDEDDGAEAEQSTEVLSKRRKAGKRTLKAEGRSKEENSHMDDSATARSTEASDSSTSMKKRDGKRKATETGPQPSPVARKRIRSGKKEDWNPAQEVEGKEDFAGPSTSVGAAEAGEKGKGKGKDKANGASKKASRVAKDGKDAKHGKKAEDIDFEKLLQPLPKNQYTARERQILDGELDLDAPIRSPRKPKTTPKKALASTSSLPAPSSPLTSLADTDSDENPQAGPSTPTKIRRNSRRHDMHAPAPSPLRAQRSSTFAPGIFLPELPVEDSQRATSRSTVDVLMDDDDDEDEELPDAETLFASSGEQLRGGRGRGMSGSTARGGRSESPLNQDMQSSDHEDGGEVFEETDMFFSGVAIGEAVYCTHGYNRLYWPAVVQQYVPALSKIERLSKGDRYLVRIMGYNQHLKSRKDLLTIKDEQFARFENIGQFSLTVNRRRAVEPQDALTREATPEENHPESPVAPDEYSTLLYRQQIRLISPHLEKVLKDQYEPALALAELFYGAGLAGKAALQPSCHGDITQWDIDELVIPELKRWCLRGDLVGGLRDRPAGSARYESLTRDQKNKYIVDFLLQECILMMAARCSPLLCSQPTAAILRQELLERLSEGMEEDERQALQVELQGQSLQSLSRAIAKRDLIHMASLKNATEEAIYAKLMEERSAQRLALGLLVDKAREAEASRKRQAGAGGGEEDASEMKYTTTGRPDRGKAKPKE